MNIFEVREKVEYLERQFVAISKISDIKQHRVNMMLDATEKEFDRLDREFLVLIAATTGYNLVDGLMLELHDLAARLFGHEMYEVTLAMMAPQLKELAIAEIASVITEEKS